jgi:hypothetical protein
LTIEKEKKDMQDAIRFGETFTNYVNINNLNIVFGEFKNEGQL